MAEYKLPSVSRLLKLLTQVQALKRGEVLNNATDSSTILNNTIAKNSSTSQLKAVPLPTGEPVSPDLPVPATGLGIGKSGNRAWVSTIGSESRNGVTKESPNKKPIAKDKKNTNNTEIYNKSKGKPETIEEVINNVVDYFNSLVAPQFEKCNKSDRVLGYVIDRDFYTEWQEDPCKNTTSQQKPTSTKSEPQTSSTPYGEGFTNTVVLPTQTSQPDNDYDSIKAGTAGESPPLPPGYKLVWQDEFDGNKLDTNKWEYEVNCLGGGNEEEQCYVAHDDVLKLQDGKLIITAIPAPQGYALMPYDKCNADEDSKARGACTNRKMVRSARIHTIAGNGGKWKYGRFEMKAKIPKGNFLWPAFWMLPASYKYGMWAASGEFDIMESRGQKPDEIGHALHYGAAWPKNVYSNLQYVQSDLAEDFMVYGMDWDDKAIRFFVNNRYTYQVETNRNWSSPLLNGVSPYTTPGQPWDQEFILLLNLAVGGNFFSGAKYNPEIDPKTWSQPYIIDYVRVYQKQ